MSFGEMQFWTTQVFSSPGHLEIVTAFFLTILVVVMDLMKKMPKKYQHPLVRRTRKGRQMSSTDGDKSKLQELRGVCPQKDHDGISERSDISLLNGFSAKDWRSNKTRKAQLVMGHILRNQFFKSLETAFRKLSKTVQNKFVVRLPMLNNLFQRSQKYVENYVFLIDDFFQGKYSPCLESNLSFF